MVVVAAVCVRLGFWQLDRLAQRRAFNDELGAALAAPPTTLDQVLAGDDVAYRRVTVTGTWAAADEVILYGRALESRPGNHVLTPLLIGDGRAVLVDRGWVPSAIAAPPLTGDEAAAAGVVTVEGIVVPADDGASDDERDAGQPDAGEPDAGEPDAGEPDVRPEQVRTIEVGVLDPTIDADLVDGVYILLQHQTPRQERPIPATLPERTEGPHLSYAIQWFTFAAIALIGYGVLARRKARPRSGAAQGSTDAGGR